MSPDEILLEPEPDPEQTGIILDRLAKDLEHAARRNPATAAELRAEAERFLLGIDDWLARVHGELAMAARGVRTADVDVLASDLRALAERLFDLADDLAPANHGGSGP
jgi:hypothetical protein